jgi:Ca-activated chloride channel homolog
MEKNNDIWYWLDFNWLKFETLQSFEWQHPNYLYLLPAILLVFFIRWLFHFKFRQKLNVSFFGRSLRFRWVSLLRFIPDILLILAWIFMVLALARPQRTSEQIEQNTEGIDIMLIIDTSGSMELQDFKPNRLESAKAVAKKFIKGRFQDRIGLVVFAGDAYSLSPLTTDYELLFSLIKDIKLKMIPNDGTAIGSALGVATNRMLESKAKSKVIILLSDGDNTAGNIDPLTAAEMAAGYGCKIYTVAIGKDGNVPMGTDLFGNVQYVQSQLDEKNLRKIAEIGNGLFFRAENKSTLETIFKQIDKMEKAEIKVTKFKDTKDYYPIYLLWALGFIILWMFTKNTFISNILED